MTTPQQDRGALPQGYAPREKPAANNRAKLIAAKSLNIPTLPAVVHELRTLLQNPATGTREISQLVAQDPPLAAKVLKIANSAFYGLRERCVSTEQACAVLGLRVLRNVVTQAAVMTRYDHMQGQGLDLDELWAHSQLVAQITSHLSQRSRGKLGMTADEFYTCGLLHDLGKVVLLESARDEYVATLQRAQGENLPVHVCEEQHFGFNHTDVGALVAIQWGLPSTIATGIQYHHGPREAVAADPVVCLIANANLLVHRTMAGNQVAAAGTLDARTQAFLGLSSDDVSQAVELLVQWRGASANAA